MGGTVCSHQDSYHVHFHENKPSCSSSKTANVCDTKGPTLSLWGVERNDPPSPEPSYALYKNLLPSGYGWNATGHQKQSKKRSHQKQDFVLPRKSLHNVGMNKLWKAFTTERDIIIIHVKQICLFCKDSFQLINYQYLLMVGVTRLLWWENYWSTCLEYVSLSTYCINLAYLSCSFSRGFFFPKID